MPRDIDKLGRMVGIFRKTHYPGVQVMVRWWEAARVLGYTCGTRTKMQTREGKDIELRGHERRDGFVKERRCDERPSGTAGARAGKETAAGDQITGERKGTMSARVCIMAQRRSVPRMLAGSSRQTRETAMSTTMMPVRGSATGLRGGVLRKERCDSAGPSSRGLGCRVHGAEVVEAVN